MRVFVAPLDSMYGMVPMFQILTDLTRPELHVVRSIDAAYRLLQVESPEFSPVHEDSFRGTELPWRYSRLV
jgi:hypothetical protein